MDNELRVLCDADGRPFLRRYVITEGLVTFVDVTLDGNTPFHPTDPVGVCAPTGPVDSPGDVRCPEQTTPAATVGLCLADGTPVAVVVERDCDGQVTQVGWVDLTTGVWSQGLPPDGTRACGDTAAFDVSGVFCDVDPDTGDVLGLVLVQVERGPDGQITGTTLISPVDGSTYTLQGELSHCPAGVQQPTQQLVRLCDHQDDGTTVTFLRDYRRDENGQIVGHTDYTLDADPYTPTGTVDQCQPDQGESPTDPCLHCNTLTLCDTPTGGDFELLQAGQTEGTLPSGVSWLMECAGPDPQGQVGWWQFEPFPCPLGTPLTVMFNRAAEVTWGVRVGNLGALGAVTMPAGTEVVEIHPDHDWDPDTLTLSARPGAGPAYASAAVSRFSHPSAEELVFTPDAAGGGGAGRRIIGEITARPKPEPAPFLRTVCYDCDGQITSTVDTTLDGQPYTVEGEPGRCQPVGQATPPCGDTELVVLCDTSDDGTVVPFLRRLTFDCDGQISTTSDLTLDGQPHQPVGEVGLCQTPDDESPADQCRNTTSLLLCQVEDTAPGEGDADAFPVVDATPFNAWSGWDSAPVGWCQENGHPADLFDGGSTVLGPGTQCEGRAGGTHEVVAAVLTAPTESCDHVTVTVSVRVENLGPADGLQGTGVVCLWNIATGQRLAWQHTPYGAPVGHSETITFTAQASGADLAAGNVAISIDLETEHSGPKSWLVDQFSATYTGFGCATTGEFLRHVTVDCDGNIVTTHDTTLDGELIEVTGEVVSCTTQQPSPRECVTVVPMQLCDDHGAFVRHLSYDCEGRLLGVSDTTLAGVPYMPDGDLHPCDGGDESPAEPCQVTSTFEVCRCDQVDDESPGEVVTYREVWGVGCGGGPPTLVHTYRDDPGVPYDPVNPVPCDDLGEPAEQVIGVQALRVQLETGQVWQAASEPLLQSVTATAVSGQGEISDENGTTTLHTGETASWSVVKPSDVLLTGPLTITSNGTVTLNITRAVTG